METDLLNRNNFATSNNPPAEEPQPSDPQPSQPEQKPTRQPQKPKKKPKKKPQKKKKNPVKKKSTKKQATTKKKEDLYSHIKSRLFEETTSSKNRSKKEKKQKYRLVGLEKRKTGEVRKRKKSTAEGSDAQEEEQGAQKNVLDLAHGKDEFHIDGLLYLQGFKYTEVKNEYLKNSLSKPEIRGQLIDMGMVSWS